MRITKNLLILTSFSLLALFSCQKRQYGYFNNHYQPYSKTTKSTSDAAVTEGKAIVNENNVASTNNNDIQIIKEKVQINSTKVNNKEISSITTSNKPLSVKEKREIKKEIRKAMKDEKSGIGTLLLVIIAIILPPVAVLLIDGLKGPFWLSLLLWLLFYVPGLIYALWRIFRER